MFRSLSYLITSLSLKVNKNLSLRITTGDGCHKNICPVFFSRTHKEFILKLLFFFPYTNKFLYEQEILDVENAKWSTITNLENNKQLTRQALWNNNISEYEIKYWKFSFYTEMMLQHVCVEWSEDMLVDTWLILVKPIVIVPTIHLWSSKHLYNWNTDYFCKEHTELC